MSLFLDRVKVHPILGFAAIRAKAGGAFRIWTVAKTLDPGGSGVIDAGALRARLDRLETPERSTRRWISRAVTLGFLKPIRSERQYKLASPAHVALAVGAEQVGKRAEIPARLLFTIGWRSNIWGAFLAALRARPMSLRKASELTAVPVRTLKRWNADLKIVSQRNYAISELPGDHVPGLREHDRPSVFVGPDGRACWRLPDNRKPPHWATPLPRGRVRKADAAITIALSKLGRGPNRIAQLFYPMARAAERAARKMIGENGVQEVYKLAGNRGGSAIWTPVC